MQAIVLGALVLAACTPVGGPGHGSDARISRHNRWFVDAQGRVVGFRGVNFVQKFPPIAPAAAGFDDDDAAFLEREGFNLVRLGVVFGSVMPQPGVIDDTYVASIANTAKVLARHHIYTLLDFHQDGYGPLVHGNGFPEWATITDGLPNPNVGFPAYYIQNPALERAFDNFWDNVNGPDGVPLQQHYAEAVQSVARAVAHQQWVLGYDLMNEPWPGTDWSGCLNGCPAMEQARLVPFEQRMSSAIRAVDTSHLVFSEPFVLFNFGHTDTVVPASTTPNAALSFHVYAATPADEPSVVIHALNDSSRKIPILATEFGATTDPATITRITSTLDDGLVPWAFWSYDENLVIDKTQPPTTTNVRQPVLDALARPYPAAVNGIPNHWHYDATSGALDALYTPRTGTAPNVLTEFVLGARAYPDGYRATVEGGRIVSAPCSPTLLIKTAPDAPLVTVHVERAPCDAKK